jgi:hypothetical protein
VPELLMRSTSPYGSRRAVLLRGSGDIYLYLEDVTGEAAETSSAVWVANQAVAPVHPPDPTDTTVRNDDGGPPRMAATGTRHPEGCPPLQDVEFVWFEEGDGVALVDDEGIVAVVPGWGGRDDFYGYSRYAQGHTPIAGDEVLGLGVVADDGGGGLLGLVLPSPVSSLTSMPMRPASSRSRPPMVVVLEVRAGRVAPRVAAAAVLLAEQAGEDGPVLVGEAPLLADAAVPVLGEGLGHLHADAVQHQVVLVLVGGEQLRCAPRPARPW